MNTEKPSIKARLALALVLTIPFAALHGFAEQSDHEAFHAALQACASENNITLPERPHERSGPPPERPQLSSEEKTNRDEERKVIDACLAKKGIAKPEHRHGPRPPRPPEEVDSSAGQN